MKIIKWLYFIQARILQMFSKYDRAIELFNMALQEDPAFVLALNCKAHLYATLKQLPLAELCFKKALRIVPNDAVTCFNLGYVYEAERKFEEAIAVFQSAVTISPRLDRAWFGMGLCFAELGLHIEAAQSLQKAADIQPLSPYPLYHLGMAYYTLGDRKKVEEVIAKLKGFDPKVARKLIEDTTTSEVQ